MDFTFDAEQTRFIEAVRRVLMLEMTPELIRELWERDTGRSDTLWRLFAAQGLCGVQVPTAQGGLGFDETTWAPLAEACGYFAVPEPLFDTALVAAGLLRDLCEGGDVTVQAERDRCLTLLDRIAAGRARVAVMHPSQPFVSDAHVADALICHHEGALHLVTKHNMRLVPQTSVDPSRRLFILDGAPAAESRLLTADASAAHWDRAFDRAALAVAAQLLGLAQHMLDLAIDHAVQRKQFGKPVGANQAVKHALADVAIQLDFARPVLYRAAYALANRHALAPTHVSHAKLAAMRVARLAARHAMQAHGAIGYTWELDLQMFAKRAWALAGTWGDSAFHKRRVAMHVLGRTALGTLTPIGPGSTFAAGP
ncbi:acyl-CoA dehydrogenase [Pandoraea terrae]|uniref:Acyl-CoA dehydrogenase n=1 Tax=Pandoraea terrae TaxID=1537710 RepID=A0A5E4ZDR4_9BURK|nr:acyl-CoA dehydrogenase family protein [Pandoraea terrae]VVE58420.1 acyl-CoA dehydrogenase [Pandoraea terrae]